MGNTIVLESKKQPDGFYKLKTQSENPETKEKTVSDSPDSFYKLSNVNKNNLGINSPMISLHQEPNSFYIKKDQFTQDAEFDKWIRGVYMFDKYIEKFPNKSTENLGQDEKDIPVLRDILKGINNSSMIRKKDSKWCLNVEPCDDLFKNYCCANLQQSPNPNPSPNPSPSPSPQSSENSSYLKKESDKILFYMAIFLIIISLSIIISLFLRAPNTKIKVPSIKGVK